MSIYAETEQQSNGKLVGWGDRETPHKRPGPSLRTRADLQKAERDHDFDRMFSAAPAGGDRLAGHPPQSMAQGGHSGPARPRVRNDVKRSAPSRSWVTWFLDVAILTMIGVLAFSGAIILIGWLVGAMDSQPASGVDYFKMPQWYYQPGR